MNDNDSNHLYSIRIAMLPNFDFHTSMSNNSLNVKSSTDCAIGF